MPLWPLVFLNSTSGTRATVNPISSQLLEESLQRHYSQSCSSLVVQVGVEVTNPEGERQRASFDYNPWLYIIRL